ncbi:MAG: hypothetical protein A3H45_09005, partial [Ignavibacteria bacterium RIFCSPLOWO2_02_FULL_55_14]
GEGGMGVVYKAQDTTLDRLVALKFLPDHVAVGSAELERFIQEAKAAAGLNHPNICTIYGIEESVGNNPSTSASQTPSLGVKKHFIVMEFVDGQTLQEKKALLSMKQALDVGIQIAEGLAAAHEKGIVHRDIKPENIMFRKDGRVQIMDFGLAKLRGASRLTKEGSTVGTAGYMSPEQVQGLETDNRSDIFSLGVLLYEMFSGQSPFKGVHETAIAYEIVNVDPDPISSFKPGFDPQLDTIVLDCLEKDLKERRQSAAEVARDLRRFKRESSRSRVSSVSAATPIPQSMRGSSAYQQIDPDQSFFPILRIQRRELIAWSLAGVLLISTGVLAFYTLRETEVRVTRATILPPDNTTFDARVGGHIALSPNGKFIVFAALDSARKRNLWVRPVSALTGQMLNGTEGADYPFWSADNRFIGFFANGKLRKIEASGGPPQTLCDAPGARGGDWNLDGVILFASPSNGPLMRVSAAGGASTAITKLDSTRGDLSHRWPWFLPDGNHFLYSAQTSQTGGAEGDVICVGSLDGTENKVLLHASSNTAYAGGHFLFLREQSLMAQPFDVKNLSFTGEAFPVAEQVHYWADRNKSIFTVSENGVLAYQTGNSFGTSQLIWFDRIGKELQKIASPGSFGNFRLSPDGKNVAVSVVDTRSRNEDIWIYDLTRNIQTRFTFDPAADNNPVWSPDGSRIVFSSRRKTSFDLYQRASSGAGGEELLLETDRNKSSSDWSLDGRFVLYSVTDPKSLTDLWILPLWGPAKPTGPSQATDDQKPIPFLQTVFFEYGLVMSPDNRWIAYGSNESGSGQVYVRPFPGPGGKYQVSASGGSRPRWRRDGKELFYVGNDNKLMAVEVSSKGQTFVVGAVRPLFEIRATPGFVDTYDATADGKRFLVNTIVGEISASPVTLVVNWDEELRKK